ncbi:altronate hydrolase [Sporosarcina newyorkensis 2681]|uniref:Altronate hydrolase n=1 Tax=Sporosarcina newyorkensis 2681 TaxID=1027292 RepID=F9DRR9_9BACL|nr:altronate hydrolase [Sporosarcina newyorkensis 2681]
MRNEIWIINTVGCINKVSENLAKMGNKLLHASNFDGVHYYSHPYGCSQLGDDLEYTQRILADLVHHPNAGGVLVLGLGCENNYIDLFKEAIGPYNPKRVKFMSVQSVEDEMEIGMGLLTEVFDYATSFQRENVPVSELKIGLKCGGSDGLSGITANPLLGSFSDRLIGYGGSTVLTEVPEMFGAETVLMERAKDEETFQDIVHLINDFKHYFIKYDQPVYENPSPGNKEGGITTLEEKSLGCVQKGGASPVQDVIEYGSRIQSNGLTLLQGPGNDLVSVTALAASGCQIVIFTTGRGTPFGGPTPTVKVSTNTPLYTKKKNWIDFNAGKLVENVGMDQMTDEFFEYMIDVASGNTETNNEIYGFKEIAIFKDGVTM